MTTITPRNLGRRAPGRMSRRGFSLVEIVSVLSVIGILAGIGAGRLQPARELLVSARLASDLRLVALTAEEYALLHDRWPQTAPEGEVPAELATQLPGLRFRTEDYVLQFLRLESPGRPPRVIVTVRALHPGLDERLDASFEAIPGVVRTGTTLSYSVSGESSSTSPKSGTIAAPER